MPRKDRLLMQRAYDEIKRRIITLELEPGERIDDYQLSVELAFSRTPVREAIFLLGAEGLVDIRTKAGFIVRPLDLIDITHLFEAHVVLAKAVARLAASRATAADLELLSKQAAVVRAAIDARDYLAITAANAVLHRLEATAARNKHLESMAESIHDQGQRLAYLCFGGGGGEWSELSEHFDAVCKHHDEMIAALTAHDADEAERVSTAHVRLFRQRVQRYLDSDAIKDFTLTDEDFALVSLAGPGAT
ncbi:MAG: GntR family transcriptional regulator [Gaiellaceae bacterium MAG52_C11]|nr:GntR family transcriptional regulator [Candidatus Gaiellasilicea maunaloa]